MRPFLTLLEFPRPALPAPLDRLGAAEDAPNALVPTQSHAGILMLLTPSLVLLDTQLLVVYAKLAVLLVRNAAMLEKASAMLVDALTDTS